MRLKFKKLNQLGQTSVEYMLLIAVAVSIGVTFFNKIDEFLIKNPNSVISRNLRQFEGKITSDPKFTTFQLLR